LSGRYLKHFWRRERAWAFAALPVFFAVCLFGSITPSFAQAPPPTPLQPLPGSDGNIYLSSPSVTLEIGTRFLRHLGTEAAREAGAPSQFTPSGGGADLEGAPSTISQIDNRYRAWFEAYGVRSEMDPRGDFGGDKRRILGGVAGLGMIVTPGVSVGLSIDQSRTDVDIIQYTQSSKINLTQIGGNIAFESGPWVLGIAAIRGFGDVDSTRGAGAPSIASYDTNLWGALAELSYLWSSGNWRVVPKVGMDWARAESDAYSETGGPVPIFGTEQIAERTRVFGGAEVGYTWLANTTVTDFSVYGRAVDILSLNAGGLTISPVNGGALPRFIAGVSEDRFGIDTGAALSMRLSPRARLYAVYDGRFRGNFESHAGTLGLEFRW
jgi:outer membrane autotransporter protein